MAKASVTKKTYSKRKTPKSKVEVVRKVVEVGICEKCHQFMKKKK